MKKGRTTIPTANFFNMYEFVKILFMFTFLLQVTRTQKQMTFYRMRGLSFSGKTIGSKEVEEPTDCLGACLLAVNCTSFNAYMIKDGNAFICEFLGNNPCGFVEKSPKSSIFFQHKICKSQTKDESKCVVKSNADILYVGEKGNGDSCLSVTLDITGTCLKINNQLVEVVPSGETYFLKLNENAEDSCLQVQLIGNVTQFQIKTNLTDMCVVLKQLNGFYWLAHDTCNGYIVPIYFTIP